MAKSFKLEIITPARLFYDGMVEMVIVKTLTGEEGFMANHTWACKLLSAGEMWIKEEGAQNYRVAAIAGGYIDVQDMIVIFTDAAEWPEEIDVERAKIAKERAEEWLLHPSENKDEVALAKMSILKSVTRMNVQAGGARRKK